MYNVLEFIVRFGLKTTSLSCKTNLQINFLGRNVREIPNFEKILFLLVNLSGITISSLLSEKTNVCRCCHCLNIRLNIIGQRVQHWNLEVNHACVPYLLDLPPSRR